MHTQSKSFTATGRKRWLWPLLAVAALIAPLSLLATPHTPSLASGLAQTTELTWTEVHSSPGVYWYTLSFPTNQVGYVSGGQDWNVNDGRGQVTIAKTTDGGLTWSTSKVDSTQYFMRGLACKDANTCWLTGGSSPRIRRTVDGGQTWLDAYDRYGYRGWTWSAGYTGTGNTVLIGTSGYFAYDPNDPNSINREANYLRSIDGISFDRVVTDQNSLVQWDFACPSPGVCYTPSKGRAYFTSNDGVSWVRRSAPEAYLSDYFYGIDCTDNNTCWMVGQRGRLLITYNGGASWQYANVSYTTPTPRFWHVDMIDAQHGYAVGCDNATLKPQSRSDPPENICTGQGMIYRTDDGMNWRRIPAPTTADIMDIHAFSMDEVIIVDWAGKIWRSSVPPTPTPTNTPSPTATHTPTATPTPTATATPLPRFGAITGIAFEDLNMDLLYNEDEPLLANAVFALKQGPATRYNATSDADGTFNFLDVEPGQYTLVEETAPPGFAINTNSTSFRVIAGDDWAFYVPHNVYVPPTATPTPPAACHCSFIPMILKEPAP